MYDHEGSIVGGDDLVPYLTCRLHVVSYVSLDVDVCEQWLFHCSRRVMSSSPSPVSYLHAGP
jgi:hypothetical protein